MWFDSHCHVSSAKFDDDRAEVLARARAAGISHMIDIGCEHPSWPGTLAFAEAHDDVSASLGIHPHEAKTWNPEVAAELRERLTSHAKARAIGEMGLDYHYNLSPADDQRRAFHEQLEMAAELKLTAVFHIREAHEEATAILAEHAGVEGIVHCFTGGPEDAERYLALGHSISFSGIVTFKSAKSIQAAAKLVPLDRMLVETDAPYLAPVPKRGKRNEPAFVAHTGAFLARLLELEESALAAATRANTARLFRLPETLSEDAQ